MSCSRELGAPRKMPKLESTNGVWIHATNLVTIGIPVQHEFDDSGAGDRWRIEMAEDGEIVLRFADGRSETYVVRAGDTVVAIEDHLYVSLAIAPGTPPGALIGGAAADQPRSA